MVESGIGPKKDLGTRKVPISCCKPNDIVGKEIGDEHLVLFMYLGTDKFGSQPKLIAEETYENAYEFWNQGLLLQFRFKNTLTDVFLLNIFFEGLANWSIGIDSGAPCTCHKPRNDIVLVQFYWTKRENVRGHHTQGDSYGRRRKIPVKGNLRTKIRRLKLWLITKIGFPKAATPHNAKKFPKKGCSKNMFASYRSWRYCRQVSSAKDVRGLFISDGSVIPYLTPSFLLPRSFRLEWELPMFLLQTLRPIAMPS